MLRVRNLVNTILVLLIDPSTRAGHGPRYIPFIYATHPRHPRTPDQARTNRKTAHKLTSATTLDEVAISGVSRLAHTPWAGHTVRMAVLRRRALSRSQASLGDPRA